jgi:rhodanese-related sulfurtransferase
MKLITRDELRAKLERGDEFKLVMTLSASAYRAKHIPTSLQFETVAETLAALDPAEEIVVYCADINCAASIYAYRFLERAGYTRVRRYAGGIADWEEARYPLESIPREPTSERSLNEPPRQRTSTNPTRTRTGLQRPWLTCA